MTKVFFINCVIILLFSFLTGGSPRHFRSSASTEESSNTSFLSFDRMYPCQHWGIHHSNLRLVFFPLFSAYPKDPGVIFHYSFRFKYTYSFSLYLYFTLVFPNQWLYIVLFYSYVFSLTCINDIHNFFTLYSLYCFSVHS